MKKSLPISIILALCSFPTYGGSYLHVIDKAVLHDISDPLRAPPFAIVHPLGYVGTSDPITLTICVKPGDEELVDSVVWAIDTWNALLPTTGNCEGCFLWEETSPPGAFLDARSVMLHELGHCAMGLDHINLKENMGREDTATRPGTPSATRVIRLNPGKPWNFVFADGFESGDATGWSSTSP